MHELTDTVVAVIDDPDRAREALGALGSEQFSAEMLHGQEGIDHLDGDDAEGVSTAVTRMARVFGDQVRIMDRLKSYLEHGAAVISADVTTEQAARVAEILLEHDGHDMWRLGEWSHNRIGAEGTGEG